MKSMLQHDTVIRFVKAGGKMIHMSSLYDNIGDVCGIWIVRVSWAKSRPSEAKFYQITIKHGNKEMVMSLRGESPRHCIMKLLHHHETIFQVCKGFIHFNGHMFSPNGNIIGEYMWHATAQFIPWCRGFQSPGYGVINDTEICRSYGEEWAAMDANHHDDYRNVEELSSYGDDMFDNQSIT